MGNNEIDDNYLTLKMTLCNLCNILHDKNEMQEIEPKSLIGKEIQQKCLHNINERLVESCKKFTDLFNDTFEYCPSTIDCNICYGNLFNNNYAYKFGSCSHIFCNKCTLIIWNNKRTVACPTCKTVSNQYFKIIN